MIGIATTFNVLRSVHSSGVARAANQLAGRSGVRAGPPVEPKNALGSSVRF